MEKMNKVVNVEWVGWDDLSEKEKQQAIESYQYMREMEEEGLFDTEGNPCTMEKAMNRAKIMTPTRRLERTTYEDGTTYIYVEL